MKDEARKAWILLFVLGSADTLVCAVVRQECPTSPDGVCYPTFKLRENKPVQQAGQATLL